MEVRETLWKRCLCTPTKPPAKNSNICLSETVYQHKGTRKKCKKTNQAAIIQWQRQCLMDKPHRKHSKQSASPLHYTFLLGSARFTAQPPWPKCSKTANKSASIHANGQFCLNFTDIEAAIGEKSSRVWNTAVSKIGHSVISLLWQLRCHGDPDHNKFSSLSNQQRMIADSLLI